MEAILELVTPLSVAFYILPGCFVAALGIMTLRGGNEKLRGWWLLLPYLGMAAVWPAVFVTGLLLIFFEMLNRLFTGNLSDDY